MVRRVQTNRAWELRRKELEAELRAVRRELRRQARGGAALPDPVAVLRRIWPAEEGGRTAVPPGDTVSKVAGSVPEAIEPAVEAGGGSAPTAAQAEGPVPRRDARFASYFVTGGLHGIEPMRHERRILRNRAMFAILLFLFLLMSVYLIFF